ncbi:MFS transporter [Actinomycetospora cinnamomea]|uniref:Na+/melibiose symporter-like transporter n=1 Tax=Actinomycetospora cinnamomea TaxID=663609 RepID=A0A2U1F3V9_9PSEU|nr:MFS transporter [Actinomycetospora cinnamomea]PVZ06848.1 Na+/melibiose symporter-like transporter [Actinomycetospora cinnamomea]
MTTPIDGTAPDQPAEGEADRRARWPFLVVLGAPAFGTTFAITALTTYLPTLLGRESGPLVTGLVIGGEGAAGLVLPLLVGLANDRTARSVAHRLWFVLVAAPLCLTGLLLVATDLSRTVLIVGAAAYFIGHFIYLTPYEALYPDLVPKEVSGRSRTAASSWRFAGLGAALVGGGFLLDLWAPAVFLVAAGAVAIGTVALLAGLWSSRGEPLVGAGPTSPGGLRAVLQLVRDRDVAVVLGATLLWNVALQGLKAFVVLFFTVGLGRSASFVSGVVFPLVALGLVLAVPLAGRIADTVGHRRVLAVASVVYGAGLIGAGLSHSAWMIALVPLPAAGAGVVMTLNYSALMQVLPAEHHGGAAGLFLLSRGAGCLIGPLAVGAAVSVAAPLFPATEGYNAMWFVIGPAVLAAVPLLLWTRGSRS